MADETSDELEHDAPPHQLHAGGVSMVVGVGASAGGIRALSEFFTTVPARTPIAYVVILHLSPDHDSKLAEVLQSSTSMPVMQVRETVTLEPAHVYVIPPNQVIEVRDGTLHVAPMTRPEHRRAPVDVFFRTLADAYGPQAAAVVLSGTGTNGSNGLRRVKEYGGLTVAQNPDEAEYGDMPRNSIATGLVDFVVPVAEIPARISTHLDRLVRDAGLTDPPPVDGESPGLNSVVAQRAAWDWRDILSVLRVKTGQDFSNYKPATLRRRVERRLNIRGVTTPAEYARLLREDPHEPAALMKELLISVTNFFRDPQAFAALEKRVIPALFERKRGGDQVRVWSVACATGEEAYSLAMLFAEHSSTLIDGPSVQIFATDLDEAAVAYAREGVYAEADVADVSPERLLRFFQRETRGYRVRREVRETVLFAHHNVIHDPPFSHLDLIVCRNLLIYLNRQVQERLIETFHFALRAGGYLFLGTSETADGDADVFEQLDKSAHIYARRAVLSRLPLANRSLPPTPTFQRLQEPRPPSDQISPGELHLRLLEQYSPPSFVVNEDNVLLHASAQATKFLQMPAGEPSRDILRIVIPELRPDLRTALHLAAQQRGPVQVGGIRLTNPGGDQRLTIRVKPSLNEDDPRRGYFLVVLEEEERIARAPLTADQPLELLSPVEPESRQLEDELERVKLQLRSAVEQYETHSEDTRAANEELQAMNEELRSAAEELEISKEELQSLNEELTTVNQELKIKIEELGLTNNDFQNLINSTDIGTIFLDKRLRVKLSTPAAQKIFNLLPTDIGRNLSDITSRLVVDDNLHQDMVRVLEELTTIEREVHTREGRHYLMRIRPYRTLDDRIDGVSLTFNDVTEWRQAELRVRLSEERLRVLVDSAIDYAIFTISDDSRIDSWSSGAERMFGYRSDEIIGTSGAVIFTPEDRDNGVPERELATARETGRADDERWHVHKDGSRLYCSGIVRRLGDGPNSGFVKIARDLTSQQHAEVELRRTRAELEDRVSERTIELQAEVTRHTGAQHHVTRLLHRIVTAQEDERRRIARDLHDQLGQQLTALRLAIERHRESHHSGQADEELERALALARQIDSEVDFLAWELRPTILDDLGLVAALPHFLKEWSAHYGIPTNFQTTGSVPARSSSEVETTFYRVAQEALTNVVKHAQATRVDMVLEGSSDGITLIIEDDGVGFDIAAINKSGTGIGLIGMRERAAVIGATLQVESAPGKGTTIYLRYLRGATGPKA